MQASGQLRGPTEALDGAAIRVLPWWGGAPLVSVQADAAGAYRFTWPTGPGPWRVVGQLGQAVQLGLAFAPLAALDLDDAGTAIAQAALGPAAFALATQGPSAAEASWRRLKAQGPALQEALEARPSLGLALRRAGSPQDGANAQEADLLALWRAAQADAALVDAAEAVLQGQVGQPWRPLPEAGPWPSPWPFPGTGLSLEVAEGGLFLRHPQAGRLRLDTATLATFKAYMACVRGRCAGGGGGGGSSGASGPVAPGPSPAPATRVLAYSPAQPVWGAWVDIDGRAFHEDPDRNRVRFAGGALGHVVWASATRLSVVVPALAQAGPVEVSVDGGPFVAGPPMAAPSFPRLGAAQPGTNLAQGVEEQRLVATRAGVQLLGGVSGLFATNATSLMPVDATGGLFPVRLGPPMQVARSAHVALVARERLYVFSGVASSSGLATEQAPVDALGELGAFSLTDGAATPTPLPRPLHEHLNGHGAVVGRQLFLVGGGNGGGGDEVERLPLDDQGLPSGPFTQAQPDGLASLPSLPYPLQQLRCLVVGDAFFVAGAHTSNAPGEGTRIRLCVASLGADGGLGPFRDLSPSPITQALARSNHILAAFGRSFLLLGGQDPALFNSLGDMHEAQVMPDGSATYFRPVPTANLPGVAQLGDAVAVGHSLFVAPGVFNGSRPLRSFVYALD